MQKRGRNKIMVTIGRIGIFVFCYLHGLSVNVVVLIAENMTVDNNIKNAPSQTC